MAIPVPIRYNRPIHIQGAPVPIPTIFTLARIAAIPVVLLLYLIPFAWTNWIAFSLFILASVTDWLDGYLARSLSQSTRFGAFLDPVADKLLVSSVLIVLLFRHPSIYLTIPACIIIGREIVISALREWMAETGKPQGIAVNLLGKIKTVVQLIALSVLLGYHAWPWIGWQLIGLILLNIAAVMTIWSMCVYLQYARQILKGATTEN